MNFMEMLLKCDNERDRQIMLAIERRDFEKLKELTCGDEDA